MILFSLTMSILSSAISGFAGMLPPKYMSAFMIGISFNGVGSLIVRTITLLSFDAMNSVKYFYGTIMYFTIMTCFFVICAFGIFVVIKQDMIIFNLASNLAEDEVRDSDANKRIIQLFNANDTFTFNEAVLNCLHY